MMRAWPAAVEVHRGALVGAVVERQLHLDLIGGPLGEPDVVARADQAGQARHHVFFDVAVEEEVALHPHPAGVWWRVALEFLKCARQPHRAGHPVSTTKLSTGLRPCTSLAPPV